MHLFDGIFDGAVRPGVVRWWVLFSHLVYVDQLRLDALDGFPEKLEDGWLIVSLHDDSAVSKPLHVLDQASHGVPVGLDTLLVDHVREDRLALGVFYHQNLEDDFGLLLLVELLSSPDVLLRDE